MERVQLHKEDLRRSLFRDVVFVLFSEPGAMGNPGRVYFVTRDCQLYGVDYLHSDVEMTDIYPLFPPLGECCFRTFGKDPIIPAGWHYMYLGVGHHMLIDESVYPEFREQIFDYQYANEIYAQWTTIVRRTLLGDE